jgi:hypothetical protein
MSLYVRIENGEVKDCWDTPPDGRPGWKNAIEVKPTIIENRQYYTGHVFDVTKDPVEIVYGVADVTVDDRKEQMRQKAKAAYIILFRQQAEDPEKFDPVALQAAKDSVVPKIAAIDACTTHDELDALL